LAYVLAIGAIYRLGFSLGFPPARRVLFAASFGLATVALPYARCVNNHTMLLSVAAWILLFVGDGRPLGGDTSRTRLVVLGSLAGFGYTLDLAAGPILLVCLLGLVAYRGRRAGTLLLFLMAALPWLVLHHAINFHIGGTWKPANAVPQYLQWPGSPFDQANMTGTWHSRGIGRGSLYALALLFGKKGFLFHNPVLLLAVGASVVLIRRRVKELPEIVFGVSWSVGTWLVYSLASTNYSGLCASVRWFVPLLAAGFYVLASFLARHPSCWPDFRLLSGWGAILAALMWFAGPWMPHMVPFYWPIVAGALAHWIWHRSRQGWYSSATIHTAMSQETEVPRAA
jgi:hypothetical protein